MLKLGAISCGYQGRLSTISHVYQRSVQRRKIWSKSLQQFFSRAAITSPLLEYCVSIQALGSVNE